MCKYVEFTLPASADIDRVRDALHFFGRKLEKIEPRPDPSWLPSGHACYGTCRDHCDCGTQLGTLAKEEARARKLTKAAAGFRKKGWSSAKVERWLDDKTRARHGDTGTDSGLTNDDWAQIVRGILEIRGCNELGFILHWMEEPATLPAITVPVRNIDKETMGRVIADQLYVFTR